MMRKTVCQLTGLMLAGLLVPLAGCRAPQPVPEQDRSLMWPPPSAPPRIAYVSSVEAPADLGFRRSWWRKTFDFVVGSRAGEYAFVRPAGIAFDEVGNLCVADPGAKAIWFFDLQRRRYRCRRRVGELLFASPVAVAARGGLFYVADSARGQVVVFGEDGKLRFVIDDALERPTDLLFIGDTLWVVDSSRHQILSFDAMGTFISAFGQRGKRAEDFNYPTHLAASPRDPASLYITDSMHFRVVKTDTGGRVLASVGRMGNVSGAFSRPKGLAVDEEGTLYVADALFDNIQVFDAEGRFLMHWGETGAGAGEFWMPSDVAIAPDGRIWVADSYNRRLQIFKRMDQP